MINERRADPQSTPAAPSIVLALNWVEELKQRVRAR
jgi:hypothetical protein